MSGLLKRKKKTRFNALSSNRSFQLSMGLYLIVLLFWSTGTFVVPSNSEQIFDEFVLTAPGGQFLLGTDQLGRDQFARLASAIPFAIAMSSAGVLIGALIGSILGISAAYIGKTYEKIVTLMTNVLLGLPSILLAILVVGVLGTGRIKTVLAVSLIYIPEFARLGRSLTAHLKNSGFVIASRLMGYGPLWILRIHIFSNFLPSFVTLVAISLSTSLLSITALSFLGLGVVPPETDLGNMLSLSLDYISLAPWLFVGPSAIIVILVVAANFLGDSLSKTVDARQNL